MFYLSCENWVQNQSCCVHILKLSWNHKIITHIQNVSLSLPGESQDTVFKCCSPPRDSGCLIDTSCWHNVHTGIHLLWIIVSLCSFFQPEQQHWFIWEMALIKHIHGCQAIMRNHLTPPGVICEANISWERPVIRHNCRDLMVILIPWESFTFNGLIIWTSWTAAGCYLKLDVFLYPDSTQLLTGSLALNRFQMM